MENTNAVKTCRKCKRELSLNSFHKSKNQKDGLFFYCKACNIAKSRESRQAYRSRPKEEVPTPEYKTCKHCQVTKHRSEFWADREKKDGLYQLCKACRSIEHKKTYIKTIKPRLQAISAARYGITLDDFKSMIAIQGNRCAICKREFVDRLKPKIDHCHASTKVRGILCSLCNQGLGMFHDSVEKLHAAIQYLLERGPS